MASKLFCIGFYNEKNQLGFISRIPWAKNGDQARSNRAGIIPNRVTVEPFCVLKKPNFGSSFIKNRKIWLGGGL